ncbi:MAG TPA: TonB-dependent receptor, partial [Bryobacteraceae bacterium]|nr:TonB-dependent receptor [Bryobacteraceae bacterium]
YTLTVEAPGFEKHVTEGIRLEVAGKVSRAITLKLGNSNETVTVSGDGINVNTVDAAVSTVVERQFVENVPLNGRSFQSLLALVPGTIVVPSQGVGISGEVTVNGQRPEANYYMVDGVSANTGGSTISTGNGGGFSGNTPGQTALGTTQGMVSVDALQEFRATTSTYSAEYGRTPGGQFSFVTRSGTNGWHGSAFDYFRNDALDASNWFNNAAGIRRSKERQNDFGGTFGGPLLIPGIYRGKDKTFFFFSYEALRLRAPQSATVTDVPVVALRQSAAPSVQPFLNAFPLPNGPDQGGGLATFTSGFTNPSTMDSTSIRLDHSFTDRFKIFGRYSDTPSDAGSRNSGNLAALNTNVVNVHTVTLGITNIVSPRMSNDARVNVTRDDSSYRTTFDSFGGATPLPLSSIPGLGRSDWFLFTMPYQLNPQLYIRPLTNRQRQTNITDALTISLGRHNLKSGIDYRRLVNSEYLPSVVQYGYFAGPAGLLNGAADQVFLYKYSGAAKPIYTNFSTYLQDEWKVNQRLSLSLGLRWDLNPAPKDGTGNDPYTITSTNISTTKLAPRGTPLWATSYGNLAPRLGIAYQMNPGAARETVLRAGFGLFYDSGNAQGSQGYNGIGFYGQTTLLAQSFPLTPPEISAGPTANTNMPYTALVAGFDPNLKLPRVYEWSIAIEQSLSAQQTLTVSYVGAAGRRLLVQKYYYPGQSGNPNFAASSGMYLTDNQGYSDYNALQVQYQRKFSRGLAALASYSWSHSTDNSSSNFAVYQLLHASSNFDVRSNFQSALTYDVPGRYSSRLASALLRGWAFDAR